ncbi:uncharacterized protein [Euwallacea fornicatus]|uniref:uncharacterized protein n=1 Tax=Euwallacea fornicatus TaxID=995702 RepID=UPI00339066C2
MSRRTSVLWNFFNPDEGDKQMALCRICGILLSYKSTVTNLKKHMVRKHPQVSITTGAIEDDYEEDQQPASNDEEESNEDNSTQVKIKRQVEEFDESYHQIEFIDEGDMVKGATDEEHLPAFEEPFSKNATSGRMHKKRKVLALASPIAHNSAVPEAGETEFDAWARSVAIQLNNMDVCRALNLQMQLQSLVTKERLTYESKRK